MSKEYQKCPPKRAKAQRVPNKWLKAQRLKKNWTLCAAHASTSANVVLK
jgi:hypothetical protein